MANQLVVISNNQALTDSRTVAEHFGKKHRHVLDSIREIINQAGGMPKIGQTPMFAETTYINDQNGQAYPMFLMNRDGFSLLAMGFTGKKALQFKLKFIDAFNRMEEQLKSRQQTPQLQRDARWIETRKIGKSMRKAFTGYIKLLEEYLAARGRVYPKGFLYAHLTNVIQGALKIDKGSRDFQSAKKLNQLDQAEDISGNVIINGIASNSFCTLADVEAQILAQLRKLNDLICGSLFIPAPITDSDLSC